MSTPQEFDQRMRNIAMLPVLLRKIDTLGFPDKMRDALFAYSFTYLYELARHKEADFLKMRYFSRRHLEILKTTLTLHGLALCSVFESKLQSIIETVRFYLEEER